MFQIILHKKTINAVDTPIIPDTMFASLFCIKNYVKSIKKKFTHFKSVLNGSRKQLRQYIYNRNGLKNSENSLFRGSKGDDPLKLILLAKWVRGND